MTYSQQGWEYLEQRAFSIRKEEALMEEGCLEVCGLKISRECQCYLQSKIVPQIRGRPLYDDHMERKCPLE